MQQYFSTSAAAAKLQMSRQWIHLQIKSGALRATNIAPADTERPRYRISEADLQAFMDSFADSEATA